MTASQKANTKENCNVNSTVDSKDSHCQWLLAPNIQPLQLCICGSQSHTSKLLSNNSLLLKSMSGSALPYSLHWLPGGRLYTRMQQCCWQPLIENELDSKANSVHTYTHSSIMTARQNKKPSCRYDSRPYCLTAPLKFTWRPSVTWPLFWYPICRFLLWSFGTKSLLSPAIFETLRSKCIAVTSLTFQGHVTSSATWPFDSPYAISYW